MDSDSGDWELGGGSKSPDEGAASPFSRAQEKESNWGNKMQERADRQSSAKNLAKSAEDGATKGAGEIGTPKSDDKQFSSAVQNTREAEEGGGFRNNVQGKALEKTAAAAVPGGRMLVNQAKKFGPLGVILMIIFVLVGIFAGTQSLAPFGLVANGLDQFNNLRTSMNKRTTYFTRFSLKSDRNIQATRASIFGKEKFKISSSLSKKLQKNNVFYLEQDGVRFLVYEDEGSGKKYAVAANDDDVGKLPNSVEVELNDGTKKNIEINTKAKIDDAMVDSDSFSNAFDRGTRTLKGHIAGWFDDLSGIVHGWLGNSRNRFKDVSDTADEEEVNTKAHTEGMDEDMQGDKIQANECEDCDSDNSDKTKTYVDDEDKDGNIFRKKEEDVAGGNGLKKQEMMDTSDPDIAKTKAESEIRSKVNSIAGGLSSAVNAGCTVMKIYSAINAIIAAQQIAQIVNYVTGFLEVIQKTQTGDAGKEELSYYMTGLSTKGQTLDGNGNVIDGKENTSSLESPAWNQFFSNGTVILANSDKVVEKYNSEMVAINSIKNSGVGGFTGDVATALSAMGASKNAYRTCLYARVGQAVTGELLEVALAVFTGGLGNVIKDVVGKATENILFNIITNGVMQVLMMMVVPRVAQMMMTDIISNMAGEDAAYMINSGFNIYSGKEMQISSGLPSSKEKLMAHYRAQQEVIAEESEYERSQRSPFDPTSKYTFIGSIVNSMMSVSNTWSSPLSTVSKTANLFGSAIRGLLPTASADGEVVFETSLNEECPNLSQISAVGDAFCNPYFVSDMSTMGLDPSEVMESAMNDDDKNGNNGNFDWTNVDDAEHNGNPDINPNSELGKWCVACATRQSQFGILDGNIADAISRLVDTGSDFLNQAIQTGVGMLPVIGSLDDIRSALTESANIGWITGESCMSDSSKYFSRYSEDQRLMESAGIIEQSAVAKFLNEYYEKNPLDNSYEGIIARYSGLTKEQVIATYDVVDYYNFIANYDPTTYGPEKYEAPEKEIQFESDEVIASENIILNRYIIYDDLRTKIKVA